MIGVGIHDIRSEFISQAGFSMNAALQVVLTWNLQYFLSIVLLLCHIESILHSCLQSLKYGKSWGNFWG